MFREGDIVEAHLGFACWPIGKDHFQLGLMLRALAIVDDGIREEAERKLRNIKVQNRRGTRKHREWETEDRQHDVKCFNMKPVYETHNVNPIDDSEDDMPSLQFISDSEEDENDEPKQTWHEWVSAILTNGVHDNLRQELWNIFQHMGPPDAVLDGGINPTDGGHQDAQGGSGHANNVNVGQGRRVRKYSEHVDEDEKGHEE
ncbi:hypothetical protein BJ165DRAFT_1399939 [Panaeolus papilionaceus]|nr:hypothetical protein BJ165DRAFT_1399939 [Panaeolus papilionaceus]